jgi:hypothetical protein
MPIAVLGVSGVAALGAAGLSAGAGIYSATQTAGAAGAAAGSEVAQQQKALAYQQGIYGTAQQGLQPYIGAGQNALSYSLGALGLPGGQPGGPQAAFSAFQQTPGYQFPLQQGNLALQRQLASMGLQGSGAALKDSIGYNQGYASQNYQNYLQQLLGVAGSGQAAVGTLGQIGMGISGQQSNTLTNIGNAQAGGIMGANNATQTGLGQAIGTLTSGSFGNSTANSPLSQILSLLGQSSYGPSASGSPAALQQAWGIGSNQYVP